MIHIICVDFNFKYQNNLNYFLNFLTEIPCIFKLSFLILNTPEGENVIANTDFRF